MRTRWVIGWCMLVLGVAGVILGLATGTGSEVVFGMMWIVIGAVTIGVSVRNGSRPWRRRADGSFPD